MTEEKQIDGLTLKDYKDMERETIAAKENALKVLFANNTLITTIQSAIIALHGKTAPQEYEVAQKAIKESLTHDPKGEVNHV